MIRTLATGVLCLLLATPAWAGYDERRAAKEHMDYEMALREFRPLAEQGDADAQYNLGVMYAKGRGVTQDYAEAVKWYRKAAAQGYAGAQYNLGVMYDKGEGVPQDYVAAHKWLHLAASKGDKVASRKRDRVAKQMTPAQIAKAQKMARNWWAAFKKRKGK